MENLNEKLDNEKKIDSRLLISLLSKDGKLSKEIKDYEVREGQLELVKEICKCFNQNTFGAFEAGTGIGKSFAYLIPAISFLLSQGGKVIVSTATINLQTQLLQKDIPLVIKILNLSKDDVKVALVKGRSNYICKRKLEEKMDEVQFFQKTFDIGAIKDDRKDLKILYEWSKNSETGDKEDIKEEVSSELFAEIISDAETCLGPLCPHFSTCFVTKMKTKGEEAHLIVTNHHVLFADTKIKMEGSDALDEGGQNKKPYSLLPTFKHLIFDEAHAIKKTAISFFSNSISKRDVKKLLSVLYVEGTKRKKKGLIVELSYVLKTVILKEFEGIYEKLLDCYGILETFAMHLLISSSNASALDIENIEEEAKNELLEGFKKFYHIMFAFSQYISKTIDAIDSEDELKEDLKEEKYTLQYILKRLVEYVNLSNDFLQHDEAEDVVFWFEKKRSKDDDEIIFTKTPLNVAKILKTYLFSQLDVAISLSATLQIGSNFAYYLNGVGLREGDSIIVEKKSFQSPFLYEENVLLCVPKDLPFVNDSSFQDAINEAITSLIKATDGRALVLFTSYSSLKLASEYAREHIGDDIEIYTQGDAGKFYLLECFKRDIKACLFATMSFWEGIDVPGEALTHLIIVKLPFTVPNHPVLAARARALERRGFNSFMCLNVPEAVILFKQGFGRLIRTKKDKGVVTVLDKRLITKEYGKIFLNSIPKRKECFAPLKDIIYNIEEFVKVHP